jgi:hypothetical protein
MFPAAMSESTDSWLEMQLSSPPVQTSFVNDPFEVAEVADGTAACPIDLAVLGKAKRKSSKSPNELHKKARRSGELRNCNASYITCLSYSYTGIVFISDDPVKYSYNLLCVYSSYG